MNEEEKKITGEIDISKTIESNIDYWRNKCFEQQKEIEELKGKNKELFEEYNKRVSTIIDYEQGLKEIIDEEDDPDTWTYHAVKKLLEEVGGIENE